MHIAHELAGSMITVEIGGRPARREDLLDWQLRDRLGVVMTSPFGALGAGLLVLLCATAFYDVEKQKRRLKPLYPSIYLFHAGRPWGFHGEFDFWPDRKEIIVTDTAEVLSSINTHAITHLAVPDQEPRSSAHRYKEPEEALDRLKQAFAYGPLGSVDRADVTLSSSEAAVLSNFRHTVHLADTLRIREEEVANSPQLRSGTPAGDDAHRYVALMRERLAEVDFTDPRTVMARERIALSLQEKRLTETLRRIDPKAAVAMLG
jgi:hypothetical protein